MTPEQIEIERKKFEEHFKDRKGYLKRDPANGFYINKHTAGLWAGWLACCDSLCVTLPKRGIGYYEDDMVNLDDVIERLQSAGINYRVEE